MQISKPRPRKASFMDALGFLVLHGPQPKPKFIEATERGLLEFMVECGAVKLENEMVSITSKGRSYL